MRYAVVKATFSRRSVAAASALSVLVAMVGVGRPARADDPAPASCDRQPVVVAYESGGPALQAAARTALLGTDADVCSFVSTGWAAASASDRRTSVQQMAAAGGPATQTAANGALASTDPAAVDNFLNGGWQTSWGTDQRVRVNQMIAAGGAQLKAAAQKALDSTDPDAVRTFLDSGWKQPYQTDLRLKTNQILAAGGPEVKAAAQKALDAGDANSLSHFIDVDWSIAATRDAETAQISQLVQTAVDAGKTAQQETDAAVEQSNRAKAEAAAAKQAAADAKAAAQRAGSDAKEAADAAKRAATAARNAASAAQQAVSAANAANSAARVAAGAAARAASAAAQTSQYASYAYNAAGEAVLDAKNAASAKTAAQKARDMAAQAKTAAEAAGHAGDAAQNAAAAAVSAKFAAADAQFAAQDAIDAGNSANASIDDANQAKAAAQRAADDAARADRAAGSAVAFANQAATAAYQSRDAANRAAADATAAAAAADDAAAHAGQAADAAKLATQHANAAVDAANAAVAAAQQAQAVYDQARQAESDQLQITYEQNDDEAKQAAAAFAQTQTQAQWDAAQASKRSADDNRLIAEVNNPATAREKAVADSRQIAIDLSGADRPWTRAAAQTALAEDDDGVLDFVQHGLTVAAGEDDRATLDGLMATGTAGFVAAANTAMNGSDADVAAFLSSQNYPNRVVDDRIQVNQVMAAAHDAGETTVLQRGQAALDSNDDAQLRAFLKQGQFDAQAIDQRVKVNQILADPDSGPEVRDAAQVALDGPPAFLDQFLQVGRYQAAQRDQDAAAHRATVSALLVQASQAATTAVQNAMTAQQAAAEARGAAADAAGYAQQAAQSAQTAAGYAQQAASSAAAAANSADQAAASAKTAVSAAQRADTSARNAARSAVWAAASARHAADDATRAYNSAKQARDTAIQAGKDAQGAADAANQAFDDFKKQYQTEQVRWAYETATTQCTAPGVDQNECLDNIVKEIRDPALYAYENGGACAILYQPGQYYDNCINDALSPTFGEDQALTIAQGLITFATGLYAYLGSVFAGVAVAEFCVGLCTAFLEAATPMLMPALIGVPGIGLDVLAGGVTSVELGGLLEELTIENEADAAAFNKYLEDLQALCEKGSGLAADHLLRTGAGTRVQSAARLAPADIPCDPAPFKPLALGINDLNTNSLINAARQNGAIDFMHLPYPDWIGPVSDIIENVPGQNLYVFEDGFQAGYFRNQLKKTDDPRQAFLDAVVRGSNKATGAATEWEMFWIAKALYQNKREWSSIKFFGFDGKPLSSGIGAEPDWWNIVVGDTPEINQLRSDYRRALDYDRWEQEYDN
jgi:hypothetical protein